MSICPRCSHVNPEAVSLCLQCQTPLKPEAPHDGFMPGTHVGPGDRYVVVSMLGAGGMGSVWRATDTVVDVPVAIKLLNSELLNHQTARTRMEREAKALAQLNGHPNIVEIRDRFDHEGRLALVLDFIDGADLRDRVDQGSLPWLEACILISKVLEGLKACHAVGIVHRDLKPGNILVDTLTQTPKLVDFGIVHDAEAGQGSGRQMTRHGAKLGTPEYMSPEQVRGIGIDGRTDIYACGIMLYELVAGFRPFEAEAEHDVHAMQVNALPDLTRLPPEIPDVLRQVIARSLEKAPEARYQSAEEMRNAMRPLTTGQFEALPVSQGGNEPSFVSSVPPLAMATWQQYKVPLGAAAVLGLGLLALSAQYLGGPEDHTTATVRAVESDDSDVSLKTLEAEANSAYAESKALVEELDTIPPMDTLAEAGQKTAAAYARLAARQRKSLRPSTQEKLIGQRTQAQEKIAAAREAGNKARPLVKDAGTKSALTVESMERAKKRALKEKEMTRCDQLQDMQDRAKEEQKRVAARTAELKDADTAVAQAEALLVGATSELSKMLAKRLDAQIERGTKRTCTTINTDLESLKVINSDAAKAYANAYVDCKVSWRSRDLDKEVERVLTRPSRGCDKVQKLLDDIKNVSAEAAEARKGKLTSCKLAAIEKEITKAEQKDDCDAMSKPISQRNQEAPDETKAQNQRIVDCKLRVISKQIERANAPKKRDCDALGRALRERAKLVEEPDDVESKVADCEVNRAFDALNRELDGLRCTKAKDLFNVLSAGPHAERITAKLRGRITSCDARKHDREVVAARLVKDAKWLLAQESEIGRDTACGKLKVAAEQYGIIKASTMLVDHCR
jgi:serine/threonine protein kinase